MARGRGEVGRVRITKKKERKYEMRDTRMVGENIKRRHTPFLLSTAHKVTSGANNPRSAVLRRPSSLNSW